MLTVTTTKILDGQDIEPAYVPPPIVPMSAPLYVAPTNPYIAPAPTLAREPDYQFRGEGGTPFGARPPIYIHPMIDLETRDLLYIGQPPPQDNQVTPKQPELPPRPGEKAVMPVPTGQQPTKPPVPAVTTPVQKPGPITGMVAGFDLARVPLWAWLVGAAVVGSRLLR